MVGTNQLVNLQTSRRGFGLFRSAPVSIKGTSPLLPCSRIVTQTVVGIPGDVPFQSGVNRSRNGNGAAISIASWRQFLLNRIGSEPPARHARFVTSQLAILPRARSVARRGAWVETNAKPSPPGIVWMPIAHRAESLASIRNCRPHRRQFGPVARGADAPAARSTCSIRSRNRAIPAEWRIPGSAAPA
jgi:hypothetical protein